MATIPKTMKAAVLGKAEGVHPHYMACTLVQACLLTCIASSSPPATSGLLTYFTSDIQSCNLKANQAKSGIQSLWKRWMCRSSRLERCS